MKRNEFLKTMGIASAGVLGGSAIASDLKREFGEANQAASLKQLQANADKIKLGASSYCYQHEIYTGAMTTETMLAEMHDIGCETIQIIDGIDIPNYPNPPNDWIDQWFMWLDKYKLTPSLMDTFVDFTFGGRRPDMSIEEAVGLMNDYIRLAKLLGFTSIRPNARPQGTPFPELWEGSLDVAERENVIVAPELRALPQDEFIDTVLDIIERTGTKHLGFTYDFCISPYQNYCPLFRGELIRHGEITEDTALYIEEAKEEGVAKEQVIQRVKRMKPKPGDLDYIERVYWPKYSRYGYWPEDSGRVGRIEDPENLRPIVPYIANAHGKFYEMNDDCVETTLEYPLTMKILVEEGYEGAIDSEYEGQRHLHDQTCIPIDEVGQVRRHQIMMRRLLGRA